MALRAVSSKLHSDAVWTYPVTKETKKTPTLLQSLPIGSSAWAKYIITQNQQNRHWQYKKWGQSSCWKPVFAAPPWPKPIIQLENWKQSCLSFDTVVQKTKQTPSLITDYYVVNHSHSIKLICSVKNIDRIALLRGLGQQQIFWSSQTSRRVKIWQKYLFSRIHHWALID